MALAPNKWYNPPPRELTHSQPGYAEGASFVHQKKGVYVIPGSGEEMLVEQTVTMTNQFGTEIFKTWEWWEYDVANGSPISKEKKTWSNARLPGFNSGSAIKLVEHVKADCHAFTPFATWQDEQAWSTVVSGILVFDQRPSSKATTAAEKTDIQDRGANPDGDDSLVAHSVRTWREGIDRGEVLTQSDATQSAVWVDDHTTVEDLVEEQVDGWYVWTYTKSFRPSDVKVDGPRFIKRQDYSYRFPVPLNAPSLRASSTATGVELEATGGGVTLSGRVVAGDRHIQPETYRFYRKKVSEPSRTAGGDPYGWWDTDPAAETENRAVIVDDSVTDLAGAPATALPSATSYTVPGDTTEPEDEESWQLLQEVSNTTRESATAVGMAALLDADVVPSGEYLYRATAVIARDESDPSTAVPVTYSGAEGSHGAIVSVKRETDGSIVIDAIAPDDPNIGEFDYGETREFTVPAAVGLDEIDTGPAVDLTTALEVGEAVAERQFARNRKSSIRVTVPVLAPLPGLRRLQRIILGSIQWKGISPSLIMTSHTGASEWRLVGYKHGASRGSDGLLRLKQTTLTLEQR